MPTKGPDAKVEISSDLTYVRFVVSAAETFADIYGFMVNQANNHVL